MPADQEHVLLLGGIVGVALAGASAIYRIYDVLTARIDSKVAGVHADVDALRKDTSEALAAEREERVRHEDRVFTRLDTMVTKTDLTDFRNWLTVFLREK